MADVPLTGEIAVEGLAEVIAGVRQFEEGVWPTVRSRLVAVADKAASFAVFIARSKGLYSTGELIEKIKSGFRSNYAFITDTARRISPAYPAGFNYPAIYEYAGSETRANQSGQGFRIRNRSTTGTRLIAQYGLGEGRVGPRAFLWPAAVEGQPELLRSVDEALVQLAADCGFAAV